MINSSICPIKKHYLDSNYEYVYYSLDPHKRNWIEQTRQRVASGELTKEDWEFQSLIQFDSQIIKLMEEGWRLLEVAEDFKKRKIFRYRRRLPYNVDIGS